MKPYDAIVLAGGASRRLGRTDKTALDVGGVTMLERVVAAVIGAERIVIVGDRRPLPSVTRAVNWCREDPRGGGPVAALAAGVSGTTADVVVVLAADLPFVAPAVPALLAATPDDGAAVLVDRTGRTNYLAAGWSRMTLVRAFARVGKVDGAAMRTLVGDVHAVSVPDPDGWSDDCDTWDEIKAARDRLRD